MQVDNGGYQSPTPWDDPTWRQDVLDWIASRLGREVDLDGLMVRLRPWSVVIRIPTPEAGPIWFKANPPSSAFEPALMAALGEWTPEHVLHPIAVDPARSFSLLPDGGALMTAPAATSWIAPLQQYAELQRSLSPYADDLLRIGVPDLRPEVIMVRFDELVEEVVGDNRIADVEAMRPRIADWVDELAGSGIAATLDHSDLHESQIFQPRGGRYAFFDWGDASVGHPFTTLLVPLRNIREAFGADAARSARDAYLDGWPGDRDKLRRVAHIACRLGPISRSLSWMRIFIGERAPVHDYVSGWLRVLLDEPPI